MRVLIVEGCPELCGLWKRHLDSGSCDVVIASDETGAIALLQSEEVDVIVLNLVLARGSALAVADFASYRQPDTKIIFVNDTTFFSDGSIFRLAPNACASVRSKTPPEDIVAMVEHFAASAR
ncbi:hypothetical protein [Tropicimonas sp.]|uniref:hypothetical protein n=1 Tax=Tropicimonas sp. TaxID=2067044 RepID=UPI003A862F88